MNARSRRQMLQSLGISSLAFALPNLAHGSEQAPPAHVATSDWIDKLSHNAASLGKRQTSPLQWQEVMDQLYADVSLTDFKQHLRFDQLAKHILEAMPSDSQEWFHTIRLDAPDEQVTSVGQEPHQVLITKVAHVRKGHSIPPHGHSNMVSAFLCLSGHFDVRLYDRLEQRPGEMVVRSTTEDPHAGPGTWSSVSDYRDNVHWLTAKTDDCYLFTCKLLSVEPGLPLNGRINLDMVRPRRNGANTFIARTISGSEARDLY